MTWVPIHQNYPIVQSAIAENPLSIENQAVDLNDSSVQPWEGFRGWSKRVPYGQNAEESAKPSHIKISKPEQGIISPTTEKLNSDSSLPNSSIILSNDDVQPWEGFRGWSPRAPYGK